MNTKSGIHIKTFGCQMNVYDSDRMRNILLNAGFYNEEDIRKAEVVLVNTCSIRENAENKVLTLFGQLKHLKKTHPEKIFGLTGCVGQRLGRTLLQRIPYLDIVMGPDAVENIAEIVSDVRRGGRKVLAAELQQNTRSYSQPAIIENAKPSEFLTVMKGCDHFCTYCIVPFVRGREKSRPIAELIHDVELMVEKGTREVTFLGQNINTYGKGIGQSLEQLIETASQVKGLERIRYVTSHPRDMTPAMIEQFGSIEKLMPALHLPFQSGSDAVLKRMGRLYTRSEYLEKIEALKKARPEIAMSADVIVGFPGETEEDFQQTLKVLDDVGFSCVYQFKYSPRPGTRAFSFDDDISAEMKAERLDRALKVAQKYVDKENESYIGKTTKVLVESIDRKKRYFSGRNPQNKVVHVMNASERTIGQFVDVEITEATGSNLRGYAVGFPRVKRSTVACVQNENYATA